MSFFDCPNCFEAIIDRPACRDCGFNLASALAAIATVAKWEFIAALPPATVTGHAVNLSARAATRRVWGPRCEPA